MKGAMRCGTSERASALYRDRNPWMKRARSLPQDFVDRSAGILILDSTMPEAKNLSSRARSCVVSCTIYVSMPFGGIKAAVIALALALIITVSLEIAPLYVLSKAMAALKLVQQDGA